MAASPDQQLKTRLFLGITKADAAKTVAAGDAEDGLAYLLNLLDAAELAELDALLLLAVDAALNATDLDTDGVSIKAGTERGLIIGRICALVGIGINMGLYPVI